jgi:hypothetical protein
MLFLILSLALSQLPGEKGWGMYDCEPQWDRPVTYYTGPAVQLRAYREWLLVQRELSPSNPYLDERLNRTEEALRPWEWAAGSQNFPAMRSDFYRALRAHLSAEDYAAGRLPDPSFAFPQ